MVCLITQCSNNNSTTIHPNELVPRTARVRLVCRALYQMSCFQRLDRANSQSSGWRRPHNSKEKLCCNPQKKKKRRTRPKKRLDRDNKDPPSLPPGWIGMQLCRTWPTGHRKREGRSRAIGTPWQRGWSDPCQCFMLHCFSSTVT